MTEQPQATEKHTWQTPVLIRLDHVGSTRGGNYVTDLEGTFAVHNPNNSQHGSFSQTGSYSSTYSAEFRPATS